MKKGLILLLALTMLLMSLAGCGSTAEAVQTLPGTWKAVSIERDGVSYTASELETLGDDTLDGRQIVIKDGGKAYVEEGGDGRLLNWSEIETGIKIGAKEYTLEDGKLWLKKGKTKIFYEKISDSQTIGEEHSGSTDEDAAEETVSETDTQETDDTETEQIENESASGDTAVTDTAVSIRESPDKYTWYIRSYVGKNCASFGYTSIGGDRFDRYGEGLLQLIFLTPDGSYVDIESDDELKQYVVTGQNLAPDTEMKFTFEKDSDGNEYENLVATQSYEEIVLSVKKVGSDEENTLPLTAISPSPDKYTWYIADYTGRNLANCGYTSLGGDRMVKYGDAVVRFVLISEDGSYIDPEDTESLTGYMVTGQNVTPNTELKLVYMKDSDGVEYDNLVESQNIEQIELNVRPVG